MISMIAAVGKNMELGKKGDLCWRIKADLQRFKELTTNHIVVMGYNTYKSLGKPLANRINIVVTKELFDTDENMIQIKEDILSEFVETLQSLKEEIFIIGGGKMYEYFLPYAKRIYLTEIHKEDPEADTYFPNKKIWRDDFVSFTEKSTEEYSYVAYIRQEEGGMEINVI